MRSILLFLLLTFVSTSVINAQIVNIESKRLPSDTIGWFGSLGASFSISKDKSEVLQIGHNGHVQFKARKHLALYIQDISFLRADDTKFANNGFFHIRYNFKWNPLVRLEAFTQYQFNSLVSLDRRYLMGIGPRLKLSQSEKYKAYLALLYMHEWEQISLPVPDPNRPAWDNINSRLSSYFSFTLDPGSNFSFSSTTYFQPLFEKFDDFRIHNESSLTFSITSKFSFTTSFRFSHDSKPPLDVPKSVYRLKNGINYKFR
jgi:hypothetical protein